MEMHKKMRTHRFDKPFRRLASMLLCASIVATLAPFMVQVAQAADTIQTLATSYQPTISERIDASGFKHPGIGFTKETLENVRTQVRAQKEPWNTAGAEAARSSSTGKHRRVRGQRWCQGAALGVRQAT